jgi:uncharacterized protein (TIGR02588 family)
MGHPQEQAQAQSRSGGQQQQKRNEEKGPPSIAEWAAAALGLLLVLGSLGVLGWEALRGEEGPPAISFEVRGVERRGESFVLKFAVFNSGPQTAADLHVSGTLKEGGQEVERSEMVFDYVPSESSRQAGLFFTRDPRGLELEMRAEGYQRP